MPTPLLRRLSFAAFGKETTQGTAVPATFYVPVITFKPADEPIYIRDESLVNAISALRGIYQGPMAASVEIEGWAFPDVIGNYLAAAGWLDSTTGTAGAKTGTTAVLAVGATTATYTLGAGTAPAINDVFQFDVAPFAELRTLTSVSGTGPYTIGWAASAPLQYAHLAAAAANNVTGTSYTHTFKLPTSSAAVTQPPSYTIVHYDGSITRQYPGMVLDTLSFTVDVKGAVKYNAKFLGWPSSTTSKPVATFTALAPFLGWEAQATIAATPSTKVISGSIDIKRNSEVVFTAQNSQTPYTTFAGEATAASKYKLIKLDDTDWTHLTSNDQPTWVTAFTAPSGSPAPVLTITGTKTAMVKAVVDLATKYLTLDAELDHVANTTDGGCFAATLLINVVNGY